MRRILGSVAVLLSLASGCGGDDDGGGAEADASSGADGGDPQADAATAACGGEDPGNVTGTVADQTIDPVASAWSRTHPTFAYATLIVLDEDATSTCAASGTGSGERLSLIFCDVPAAGEYDVVTPEAFPEDSCPGDMVASAIVEDEGGSDLDTAESGTITIDAVDGCRTGTFSITFTTGSLTGDFAAPVCD